MKFQLEIELGNDAMQKPWHVAEALEKVVRKLHALDEDVKFASAPIFDVNGNRVGKWQVADSR